jgi:hypothetical protein
MFDYTKSKISHLFQVRLFITNFYINVEQASHMKLLETTTPTLLHTSGHKPISNRFKITSTIIIIVFWNHS